MSIFSRIVLFASLTSLLAAGCAKPSPASPPPTTVKQLNVCDFIDAASASDVLGGKVEIEPGPAVASGNGFVSTCQLSSDEARSINILLRQSSTASEALQIFNDSKTAAQSSGFSTIDLQGYGTGAFWVGDTQNQLNLVSKNNWFVITVFALLGDDRLNIGKKAAAALLRTTNP
ncbi:hypothetical protein HZC53_01160 [Candidatus Uhrbacteria bacterium]|nr:hypothetical protein [Candidatus Uhrbacteria bacterium]